MCQALCLIFWVDLNKNTPDLPATHQDCAHSENHRSNSVIKFEAPVVNGDFVRSHHRRDHLGEGADEDVRHEDLAVVVRAERSGTTPCLNNTEHIGLMHYKAGG